MREAVTLIQRLSIMLRYLAHGNGFEDPRFSSGHVHYSVDSN